MILAKADAVVRTAVNMVRQVPPISYAQMDCQKFIKECATRSGGSMAFSGSNDMYRNACSAVYLLQEARAKGLLRPGWLLFIVENDGQEPTKYQGDGLGNASHVGMYVDLVGVEVAHSSQSKGMVCASTLRNAWTHAGPAKAMDYGVTGASTDDPGNNVPVLPGAREAVVISDTLRLRKAPTTSGNNVILQLARGDKLLDIETDHVDVRGNPWIRGWTVDRKHRGYAMVQDISDVYLEVGIVDVPEVSRQPDAAPEDAGEMVSLTVETHVAKALFAALRETLE